MLTKKGCCCGGCFCAPCTLPEDTIHLTPSAGGPLPLFYLGDCTWDSGCVGGPPAMARWTVICAGGISGEIQLTVRGYSGADCTGGFTDSTTWFADPFRSTCSPLDVLVVDPDSLSELHLIL